MSKKDTINVYWAPASYVNLNSPVAWNMLYPDPVNLFTELNKNKNMDESKTSYFVCPAFKGLSKKTYMFKNAVNCKYQYNFSENPGTINPITENFLDVSIKRGLADNKHPMIALSLFYIFFSDQPLLATFSPPTFNEPGYTKYGAVVPGEFDIGQWFRPYPLEMQLWEKNGTIEFKEDEPFFYVKFNTDKKINLQRFNFNEQLSGYSNHCTTYGRTFGSFHDFSKMYLKFKQSNMKSLILKEIKNNLVEEIK